MRNEIRAVLAARIADHATREAYFSRQQGHHAHAAALRAAATEITESDVPTSIDRMLDIAETLLGWFPSTVVDTLTDAFNSDPMAEENE